MPKDKKLTFDPVNHVYRANDIVLPSVTEVLTAEGYISSFGATEADRVRGKYTHRICELADKNNLNMDSVDPLLMPRLTAWQDAKKALGIDSFDMIEVPLYSQKWQFAGTLDRGYLDLLLDIKSGSSQPGFCLQTGGYKILREENGSKKVKRRCSVYLGAEGKFHIEWHKDANDEFMFLCALKGFNWKRLKGIKHE